MKIVCAWCGKVMKEGDGMVSHGICEECKEKMLAARPAKKKEAK